MNILFINLLILLISLFHSSSIMISPSIHNCYLCTKYLDKFYILSNYSFISNIIAFTRWINYYFYFLFIGFNKWSIRRIYYIDKRYCSRDKKILKCFGCFEYYEDVKVDKRDTGDNGFYNKVNVCIYSLRNISIK